MISVSDSNATVVASYSGSSSESSKSDDFEGASRHRTAVVIEHRGVLRSASPLGRIRPTGSVQFGVETSIKFDNKKCSSSIAVEAITGKCSPVKPGDTSFPARPGVLYPFLENRLSLVCHSDERHTRAQILSNRQIYFFSTDLQDRCPPLCADFEPVHLGVVMRFCNMLKDEMTKRPHQHIAYYCDDKSNIIANTAFLMAAYLVIEHHLAPDQAVFPLSAFVCTQFRDASYSPTMWLLSIRDCLGGIYRAMELDWFVPGKFDADVYDERSSSEGGNVSFVCPRLLAFKGPKSEAHQTALPPEQQYSGHRADFYAAELAKHNVKAIVRLNDPRTYDRRAFLQSGINHYDLHIPTASSPTRDQVNSFLDVVRNEDGRIAVHCETGLGRTCTMIGAWLMKQGGFSPGEAVGWLRVVRPGSVTGVQQAFLERLATTSWEGNRPQPAASAPSVRPVQNRPVPPPSAAAVRSSLSLKSAPRSRPSTRIINGAAPPLDVRHAQSPTSPRCKPASPTGRREPAPVAVRGADEGPTEDSVSSRGSTAIV